MWTKSKNSYNNRNKITQSLLYPLFKRWGNKINRDLTFWFIVTSFILITTIISCAHAPSQKKAELSCIKAKTDAGVKVYFCLELDGDAYEQQNY